MARSIVESNCSGEGSSASSGCGGSAAKPAHATSTIMFRLVLTNVHHLID
jgi:hypothetical protein